MSPTHDPYARERAAATAGKRVQANRGSDSAPNWVTLDGMPEFTCAPELYRVHPDDVAAPAASEGEDGAVAWTRRKPTRSGAYGVRGFELGVPAIEQFEAIVAARLHDGELMCNLHKSTSESDVEEWTPVADLSDKFEWCEFVPARPAAQVAATPKHDEGRCKWNDGSPCVEPRPVGMVYPPKPAPRASGYLGDNVEWNAYDTAQMEAYARAAYSDGYEAALATQPAARRVTDDPRVAELIEAAQKALDKAWEYGEDQPHFARLNAALESFAQPAEGVSRG